jgi:adenine-specific DNA-methyltransferase
MAKKPKTPLSVEALKHDEAKRRNIPTAEFQSVMQKDEKAPVRKAYARGDTALPDEKKKRNRDLDPQLVWRGKDEQDWSDLVVHAPPMYIQEKVQPKVLIDDLRRQSEQANAVKESAAPGYGADLFADFNGLPNDSAKTEFYQHDAHWANRMILGDSLQVMASLAEREGLRGKVQCIYFDPPYGIKFNSNFQWSTTDRSPKDGNTDHITREPEQVKAFRDTWRDGIHSYLTYLRDRLTVARDLLTESGSLFVQIGDENVDKIKALLEEVFGGDNFLSLIFVTKTSGFGDTKTLGSVGDFIVWVAKNKESVKYRQLYLSKDESSELAKDYKYQFSFLSGMSASDRAADGIDSSFVRLATYSSTTSQGETQSGTFEVTHRGKTFTCPKGQHWKTTQPGLKRLAAAMRIYQRANSLRYVRLLDDYRVAPISNSWGDLRWGFDASEKRYVVETNPQIVARCFLMATDPGDLVLDPTCGSGTTAYVAEQWGRRWITIDTSRVALALARARIMGARYPFYLLGDSPEGQRKDAELTRTAPKSAPTHNNIRHGFVYERVPHITLKSIANNVEIDVIWDKFQHVLESLLEQLNRALGKRWQEWEIPREADPKWSDAAKKLHADWWERRIARQREIDASIAAKAESEYLYDKPYEDKKTVRVAGPFTVESLSPHRVLGVDEDDELIDGTKEQRAAYMEERDFTQMILENLRIAGVQQAHKEDRITFTALTPWPGDLVCAEGRYVEGTTEKRAAVFVGPEFGTVSRPDLVSAAREAGDADFDVLIACAFNYDAHSSEFDKLGRIPVLKARMNADLHMADDLKNTGKGNLFVIFGEPDIVILDAGEQGEPGQVRVKVNGVDVFHPNTGEVRSDGPDGIACWFIDTDYNEESFFVRHAYFLGANDPYKALKITLKSEINEDAWATLNSDTSRPFDKPKSGRIAVKVINHLGDEVMKVFKVA